MNKLPQHQNNPARGVAAMVAAGFLLAGNDAAIKWLSAKHAIGQLILVRGLFVLAGCALIVSCTGGLRTLHVHDYRTQIVRGLLVAFSTFTFLLGLRVLPLAEAVTITFASPIFLTALAPRLLNEHVGPRRWAAAIVGFAGVLIVLQPTPHGINWVVLLPLAAACSEALKDIVTRRLHETEHTNAILIFSAISIVSIGLVVAPVRWSPLDLDDVLLLGLAGGLITAAYFLVIEAFRFAEASLVSPFKYSMIIWALLLGLIIWGDAPSLLTGIGLALIVISGLYIAARETRRGKPAASPLPPPSPH
jgi:drug/metabolite transporter (DMT)-like permease